MFNTKENQNCESTDIQNKDIKLVEQMLGIKFAPDYRFFLKKYNFLMVEGTPIFGIGIEPSCNTLCLTDHAIQNNLIPKNTYIISTIDKKMVVQNKNEKIYIVHENKATFLADDLESYIKMLKRGVKNENLCL